MIPVTQPSGLARRGRKLFLAGLLVGILAGSRPGAADELFRDRIAPIFAARCLGCHNDLDRKGGFSLETAEDFFAAEPVVAGDPTASGLIDLVVGADGAAPAMPKTGAALTAEEVAALREWIAAGAHWPE
jgi:mono/diheme cytochrome c family protein